jgi:hypothetical protein
MMKMMGQDGDAMAQMMEGMMGNHQMMGQMMDMMVDKGMMSDE